MSETKSTVIELLLRERKRFEEEIAKVDRALLALEVKPGRVIARIDDKETERDRYREGPKRQLEIDRLEPPPPLPSGLGTPWRPTIAGKSRYSLAKGSLDDAIVAFLRAEQHRPFVRLQEMARELERGGYRRPDRSERNWRLGVSHIIRRMVAAGRVRKISGGCYSVVRRSPGVEAPIAASNRKPRNRKAHGSSDRGKSPSDSATS